MHCLRVSERGDTPGGGGGGAIRTISSVSDRNRAAALMDDLDSPAKATNTTGIYLDHLGAPLEVQLANGRTAMQGTTFRDRILPAALVVLPVASVSSKRIKKGLSNAVAKAPPTLLASVNSNISQLRIGYIDDDEALQSARSTGSSSAGGASSGFMTSATATPTTAQHSSTQQRRSVGGGDAGAPSVSAAAGMGGGDNHGDGYARIDQFFQRMRQDLRDFRRVDLAEMGRQHLADVAMRMAVSTNTAVSGGASRRASSSAQLSPWIRVDPKRRSTTNDVFQSLQQTALADISRPDVKKYLLNRQRKYHQNVQLIYEPAKLLLEAVWDQHRIPKKERAAFMALYFDGVGDIVSYDAISRELERFHQFVSEVDIELLRQVSLRESHIAELKLTLQNAPQSLGAYKAGQPVPSTMTKGPIVAVKEEAASESAFVMSVLNCVCLLRYSTCMIIDLVQKKRGALQVDQRSSTLNPSKESIELANKLNPSKTTKPHQPSTVSQKPPKHSTTTASPLDISGGGGGQGAPVVTTVAAVAEEHYRLMWAGENYLITMQHDLDFLHHSPLQTILDPAHYRLLDNPLLLPNVLLDVCQVRNESVKGHVMPLAIASSSKSILQTLRGGSRRIGSAASSRDDGDTSSTVTAGGGLRALGNASPPLRCATPTSSVSMSNFSSGDGPVARPTTSMSIHGHKRSASPNPLKHTRVIVLKEGEEVVVASAVAALEESALSASGMSRDQFFAKVRKEELLRTQRIPMDRSNVYKYPAEVYRTQAASPWVALSHRLRRSLDPRIPSKPYDDVAEFELLQFGRLTVPPSQAHPYNDPMVDASLDCIRSVLSEVPTWTPEELIRRDILIFGEDSVVLRASAHAKLHRGLARFRMAYRGFVASMQSRRLAAASGGGDEQAAARGFVDWVQTFAPSWLDEVSTALIENDVENPSGRMIAQAMKDRRL